MTLSLLDSSDLIPVEHVCLHVYSEPGLGKTTLANTGRSVLLADFDRGAHRSLGRQRVVRLDAWEELEELIDHSWFKEASLIGIDTVGRALELLTDSIIREDGKKGSVLSGLNQQGWGVLKVRFASFFRAIREAGKDVILLSHAKTEKDKNGNKTAYPDIPGGSAGEVFRVSDGIGFLHMDGNRRTLSWDASDFHIGKNPPAWKPMPVPDYQKAPHFLSEQVIDPLKAHLNALSAEQSTTLQEIADWTAQIDTLTAPDEFTRAVVQIAGAKSEATKAQIKTVLWRRAQSLGFDFDKEQKVFVKKETK